MTVQSGFSWGFWMEMGVGASGAQDTPGLPWPNTRAGLGHVCAPGSPLQGAGWARCSSPPPALELLFQIPRNHQEQAWAGVFLQSLTSLQPGLVLLWLLQTLSWTGV